MTPTAEPGFNFMHAITTCILVRTPHDELDETEVGRWRFLFLGEQSEQVNRPAMRLEMVARYLTGERSRTLSTRS